MVENSSKYKEIAAPEGGWGYMICLGLIVIFGTCTAPTNSFGLIFNDFFIEHNETGSIMSTTQGICGVLISLSGLIVSIGMRWFSLRQLCLFGAFFYTLCWFSNIFVQSVDQILFTNGFLNGIGFGMMNVSLLAVFNKYFVKKRVMMMSISMSIVGIAPIVFPFIVEHWLIAFGFRGTVALIAAFSANTFIGAALLQPVEWHIDPKNREQLRDLEENLVKKNFDKEFINTKSIERGGWDKFSEFTNLGLLKKFTFWNVAIGAAIGIISDVHFFVLLPMILFEFGLNTTQIALAVSLVSISDLISRMTMGIVSRFIKINSSVWFLVGIALTLIGRSVFLQFTGYIGILISLTYLGFLRGWIYVLCPVLFAEALPEENYVTTYGLASVVTGFVNVIMAPILRIARDYSGSYVYSFLVLAAINCIPIVPWSIELFYLKRIK